MLLKNIGSLKFLFWAAARKCFTHFHRVKLIFGAENIRIGSNVYIDSKTVLDGENLINDNCRLVNARLGKYSYVSPNSIMWIRTLEDIALLVLPASWEQGSIH
jgi:hypothetical protein